MKKKLIFSALFGVVCCLFASCDDYETYAEQKEKEYSAIDNFVNMRTSLSKELFNGKPMSIISEAKFHEQGDSTSVEKNEFVRFDNNGVYMQIVSKGDGELIKSGDNATVLVRFYEYNVSGDSLQLTNQINSSHSNIDKFDVRNTSGTFEASFDKTSLMYSVYQSQSVPKGWLVPLTYIKPNRPVSRNYMSKVRILVPHDLGQAGSSQGVYACFYDLECMLGE